jgi:hypothetical protein
VNLVSGSVIAADASMMPQAVLKTRGSDGIDTTNTGQARAARVAGLSPTKREQLVWDAVGHEVNEFDLDELSDTLAGVPLPRI